MKKKFNIENCLFYSQPEVYEKVKILADSQIIKYSYPKINLLKNIIKNFAKEQNVYLQILYLPFNDNQVWGIFYQLDGVYFIIINSEISINKQNVALVHEYYHFYIAVTESYEMPDIIKENNNEINYEDKKANAFAAAFLMPETIINVFLSTYKLESIDEKIIAIKDVMEFFMVPYKTAVIRLMELKKIGIEEGLQFLNKDKSVESKLKLYNLCEDEYIRWGSNTEYMDLGNLKFLMHYNKENELLPASKIKEQEAIVKKIILELGKKE